MGLSPEQLQRYKRHILLREIGAQGQQKLLESKVLVIGAGGIGCPVLAYLAASGIGEIGICDDDEVDLSNLQRQILFTNADQGRKKTDAAYDFIRSLNTEVKVNLLNSRLTKENVAEMIAPYDLVIEGVDNFATRYILSDATRLAQIPLLSAAIGRFDGQLNLFKPWQKDAAGRPLPCYQCLVPEPPADAIDCESEGVLGPIPGVMGTLAALQAIKEIAHFGEPLAGNMLIFDGLAGTMRKIKLRQDPRCNACANL
ncbi:MAG: HesA/MoeB/ThiF family protein [bacterium]